MKIQKILDIDFQRLRKLIDKDRKAEKNLPQINA